LGVNLTPNEILIISLVALIALGPKQLPDAVRKAARALSELRRHSSELRAEVSSVVDKAVEDSHDVELQRQVQKSGDLESEKQKARESE
tara:strand:- start:401 stop:667 length:267 start_codon:yes stop_codon:yes gene_type:complete